MLKNILPDQETTVNYQWKEKDALVVAYDWRQHASQRGMGTHKEVKILKPMTSMTSFLSGQVVGPLGIGMQQLKPYSSYMSRT